MQSWRQHPSKSAQATAAQSETNAQKDETAAIPQIAASKRLRFVLRPGRKRHVVLAASVVIAATLGAVAGIAISGSFSRPAAIDVATVEESKAMQQSVARLTKENDELEADPRNDQQLTPHSDREGQRASQPREPRHPGLGAAPAADPPRATSFHAASNATA